MRPTKPPSLSDWIVATMFVFGLFFLGGLFMIIFSDKLPDDYFTVTKPKTVGFLTMGLSVTVEIILYFVKKWIS